MAFRTKKIARQNEQELSVVNHYSIEILESIGNQCPTQADIDSLEKKLMREARHFKQSRSLTSVFPVTKKKKILLIEGDALYACVHAELLRNLGFSVDYVCNLTGAISKNLHMYHSIIVSDVTMTQSTLFFVKLAKQYFAAQAKILVFLEDKTYHENVLLDIGVTAVLTKPIFGYKVTQALGVEESLASRTRKIGRP